MKALSIKQPWAAMIAAGIKTIETRTWSTTYRGELLLVSSASPRINGLLSGCAFAVAALTGCRPMVEADEEKACCKLYPNAWAWTFKNVRLIRPFPVKGSLKFFDAEVPGGHEEYYGTFDLTLKLYYVDCLKLYTGKP